LIKQQLKYFIHHNIKAAINGRVLILDGIEKAERNILPILNNLLENREMSLEDGRLLIDSKRYSELTYKSDKIIQVHPDFLVVKFENNQDLHRFTCTAIRRKSFRPST
jgi:hypothetical protein